MEVILTESVRKLGKVGDIVKVKDGYGRNFLLPNEKAMRATKDAIAMFEQKKQELESKSADRMKQAQAAVNKLKGKYIKFITQTAADGRLFGSVSSKLISENISKESGFDVNYSHILLNSPIKSVGVYQVNIIFHADVHEFINIVVARSESEANELIQNAKDEKAGKKSNEQQAEDFANSGLANQINNEAASADED